MYTIGQFSKLGKVSTKTLRYYDDIDLLKPDFVDQNSQYRYYSHEQVRQLLFIAELKEYGLRLEEIKIIIDKQDACLLKSFLEKKIDEIEEQILRSTNLKDVICNKIINIENGGKIMDEKKPMCVELKTIEPMLVISRRAITSMSNISGLIGKVFEDIYHMKLQPAGPLMMFYHDQKGEFDIENADCEACMPISFTAETANTENIKQLPEVLVAAATYVGVYSKIGEAYSEVLKWIDENGYTPVAAPFDVYLKGPRDTPNPEEFVTEVCFPVGK